MTELEKTKQEEHRKALHKENRSIIFQLKEIRKLLEYIAEELHWQRLTKK